MDLAANKPVSVWTNDVMHRNSDSRETAKKYCGGLDTHTYIHTIQYMHTYIHTYFDTYIPALSRSARML